MADGFRVSLAARNVEKLAEVAAETRAQTVACDVSDHISVRSAFAQLDAKPHGPADVVVFNPSLRVRGPLLDLDPGKVEEAIRITAFGGFLVAQEAVRRMIERGGGVMLFTGASASVKGYPQSAAFAMGKFALRGLAQSMARELHPKGIHVCHVVIDGGIRNEARGYVEPPGKTDSLLDPDAIAASYLQLVHQPRSAWTFELELRPWVETF
jgi:NAD(P)-dependent dehydrogenase (short-subunit alcohol dehydrogenase family)